MFILIRFAVVMVSLIGCLNAWCMEVELQNESKYLFFDEKFHEGAMTLSDLAWQKENAQNQNPKKRSLSRQCKEAKKHKTSESLSDDESNDVSDEDGSFKLHSKRTAQKKSCIWKSKVANLRDFKEKLKLISNRALTSELKTRVTDFVRINIAAVSISLKRNKFIKVDGEQKTLLGFLKEHGMRDAVALLKQHGLNEEDVEFQNSLED